MIKKRTHLLLFLLSLCLVLACMIVPAHAEGTVVQANNIFSPVDGRGDMKKAVFTITGDASTGSVPNTAFAGSGAVRGFYLYTVEMISSTDDVFTVTITTGSGTSLFEKTTTAATSGEIKFPDAFFPVYDTPSIDVTDLAAGETCTVTVIFVR